MSQAVVAGGKRVPMRDSLWKKLGKTRTLQLMILPGIAWYILFCYVPMYGVIIAFENYKMPLGILGSQWVGLKEFIRFFTHPYFFRVIRNTLLLNIYSLIYGFPAPILFALLLNEVRAQWFKKTVQTISYLPNFISTVAIVGMLVMFLSPSSGFVNAVLSRVFGIQPIYFMAEPGWFRTVYIASGIWQGTGWGAIIYLAALTNIDPGLYEAATIDGAGRLRRIWHITLPGIQPTIVVLFIFSIGGLMSSSADKVLLMYNPVTYETADVIGTFVYRVGLIDADYSFSTAVGLVSSVVNVVMIVGANALTRKYADYSMW